MPPRRSNRQRNPPVILPPGNPDDEEVFSVHSIDDSSASPPEQGRTTRASNRLRSVSKRKLSPEIVRNTKKAKKEASPLPAEVVLTISDDSTPSQSPLLNGAQKEEEDDELLLEDVDIPTQIVQDMPQDDNEDDLDDEEELELEDVQFEDGDQDEEGMEGLDHTTAYNDAYQAANADTGTDGETQTETVVFKDGKGQPNGISISLGASRKSSGTNTPRKAAIVTPRDRMVRLATHKWTVLSLIAHTRARNAMINDESLRDRLYSLVPNAYLEKLRMIHKKKVPLQTERVRLFENFVEDLTEWWSKKFHLDAKMTTCGAIRQPDTDLLAGIFPKPGRRVDGWIVESAQEREDRHRDERKRKAQAAEQAKKAAKKSSRRVRNADSSSQLSYSTSIPNTLQGDLLKEITLFGIGNSTKPSYMRLADVQHRTKSAQDMLSYVEKMSGSREDNAQLFAALCRSLGIPARLVISIQCPSWSVGASKVAATSGAVNQEKGGSLNKRKKAHEKDAERKQTLNVVRKAIDVMTSDEENFSLDGSANESANQTNSSPRTLRVKLNRKRADPVSVSNTVSPTSSRAASLIESPKSSTIPLRRSGLRKNTSAIETSSSSKPISNDISSKTDEKDYRSEKWRGLDKPLEVKYQPKLRALKAKPLKATEVAAEEADAEPVDTQSPPTMWVEVFSKPWQKWITVDPVRGFTVPTGNRRMEPSNSDKSNRLVYVLAFEEDGHARDVTARYTRTLYSRISRMRPPSTKKGGEESDWWSRVVASVQRQDRFARDIEEDEEMQTAASREPMPSSVAAFKDHPVYALEKHLKRDEVIFPAKQAGTFQGTPVFLRANVIACRSSRQWYNEGRVIKEGEEALKWVKSRGYTLANKRAEEEARQQGMDGLQEGLYAPFQTEVYTAPPIVDGKIPTNAFGNVDLFVDSMLPPGGVHIPYNGAGKVAKKLEIPYAEAVVGFEFRKHRGMPKIKGIVVAEEYGETVTEAFLEFEEEEAARNAKRKKEQALKAKRKEINAVKIKARLQRDYLTGAKGKSRQRDDDSDTDDSGSIVYADEDDDDDDDDDDEEEDDEDDDEEEQNEEDDEEKEEQDEDEEQHEAEQVEDEQEDGNAVGDENEKKNLAAYRAAQAQPEEEEDEEGGFIIE
ncbi:hypothetical protein L7F22_003066 [Adiantum nelumboides]|nr:hypothetical protein [Adiantum nelumboides]